MFSAKPRENDLRVFLSLQGVDVTAYTFEKVRVALGEMFCTPKSSMKNPSLRTRRFNDPVSRYCSFYRTFIVEDGSEEEFGQCATDELTGEEAALTIKTNVYWSLDDNHSRLKARPFKSRQ